MNTTDFLYTLPEITDIQPMDLMLNEPFIDFAARFSSRPGTVLLMSGGDLDCARYHILSMLPWLILKTKDKNITLEQENCSQSFYGDPVKVLKNLLLKYRMPASDLPAPICAGLTGYFAYDFKDCLEDLPRTCVDDLCLPDVYLTAPKIIVVHDKVKNQTRCYIIETDGTSQKSTKTWFCEQMEKSMGSQSAEFAGGKIHSNYDNTEYKEAVKTIIDYIAAGDVYQVNMSQRFETDFSGSPFGLFCSLYKQNPAPFFAYINAGDHYILSTSPERFIKQRGHYIETRPIKGTRPRGKTPGQDRANRQALLDSPKDDAELSMIVDLQRNDLGRVCRGGSVKVARHKKMEAYDNVFHMISIVQGELDNTIDAADILAAAFPGGSITGCPKIRAMEIIDELEPVQRHIYTGSIGYISFHDTMDLSIAIRTAVICNSRLFYAAGGAIVYDSDPEDEYKETLAKADTLLTAFTGQHRRIDPDQNMAWLNGKICAAEKCAVPLDSPGFQYGAGLFETLRCDNGVPQFLDQHIQRLTSSWASLFQTPPPDMSWDTIIGQVLFATHLDTGTAAVKIMAAHGSRTEPPFSHTLMVTARPYIHRLKQLDKPGLDLVVYPMPRLVETAIHKTLNYFFYYRAGQWAKQNNGDEAIIMNPDDTVSETNTANLLLIRGTTAVVPVSPTALNGIMQAQIINCLKARGYEIVYEKIRLENCLTADSVLVTNSLMGVVSVLSINGEKTPVSPVLGHELNREMAVKFDI